MTLSRSLWEGPLDGGVVQRRPIARGARVWSFAETTVEEGDAVASERRGWRRARCWVRAYADGEGRLGKRRVVLAYRWQRPR